MNAKNSRNLWIEFRQKRSEGPEWVEACAFCVLPERKIINFATRSFNSEYWMFSSCSQCGQFNHFRLKIGALSHVQ